MELCYRRSRTQPERSLSASQFGDVNTDCTDDLAVVYGTGSATTPLTLLAGVGDGTFR